MIVHSLLSEYRATNNYLIEIVPGKFVGIDIGTIEPTQISALMEERNGTLEGYFLTHAHGDHTIGIQALWEIYKMPIYCSEATAIDMNDSRKNYSIYSEDIPTFKYDLPCIHVEDGESIRFEDKIFKIMLTPGHSPGCIVVFHENAVFTGDFVMKDYKTPLNLPNSNRKDYGHSREKFVSHCANDKLTFYPGHGRPFSALSDIF